MKRFAQSEKGYTGIDVAVSIVILSIFTALISTIFINIYLQYTDAQRNAVATSYATSISELVDKMYYKDINNASENDEEYESSIQNAIKNLNIGTGYTAQVNVERYIPEGQTEQNSMDLIKTVDIEVGYMVGNSTKSVRIRKKKAKEILITPNRPKLSDGMVPVKYVVTDEANNLGYWQISSENDPTWYNYYNKVWATVMLIDGLKAEGNVSVTDQNKVDLAGKRIITENTSFAWIPKFAYNSTTEEVAFIYSTSDNIVNNQGDLEEKGSGFTISNAFDGKTGFWISKTDLNSLDESIVNGGIVSSMTNSQGETVTNLSQSKYGLYSEEWQNLSSSRKVITVR